MREGESQKKPETEIKGFSVSKGIAHGEAFVLLHKELQTPVYEVRDADKPAEIKRFENAILKTRKDILDVKSELSEEIGSAEASIFDAHILVLEDVAVMQETLSMFKENNYNIEYCYSSVINKFIAAFERIDDPYIKERIADFKDVSRRVLGNMLGVQTSKIGALSDPLILVSSDFAPADFSLVDKSKILAIVTEKGSQTSHTAILSRSLGIPCVVGIPEVAKKVSTGDMLLVDGYNGSIVINPSESTVSHYTELESAQKEIEVLYATSLPYPSVTPDGRAFSVEINISSPADISEIRFCFDHRDIFLTQLRAILRASAYGKVKILLPMISSIREVEKSKLLIEQAKEELTKASMPFDKNIELGVMIEVPGAALTTDVIAAECDFISIGTNDLIQYLLAVDRVNDLVANLYEPTHTAVIRTLNMVVSYACKAGIPVSVCGELAADPIFAPLLLGMGVTEFSMSAKSVSEIKFLLRKVPFAKARALRDEILTLNRSRHIASRLRSFHYEALERFLK